MLEVKLGAKIDSKCSVLCVIEKASCKKEVRADFKHAILAKEDKTECSLVIHFLLCAEGM